MDAEYIALALVAQEGMPVRQSLKEMRIGMSSAISVFVANTAATAMARSAGSTSRAKNVDLRYHFVRDHVENDAISVKHVRSADQLADYMTKPLPTPTFADLMRRSGIDPGS